MILGLIMMGAPADAGAPERVTRARWVMGTVCEVTAEGPRAEDGVEDALGELERLDRVMSRFREDSELSRLNREGLRGPVALSDDLWAVLDLSTRAHALSGGAFDPAAGSGGTLARLRLDPESRAARFEAPMRLDLGGIGKGYALDRAAERLAAAGVRSALFNFGGQVLALGAPAGKDAWEVRLDATGRPLRLADASVSVSSQRENPGHILDPATGRPARDRGSVAVIARDAATADAWSTALYVAGPERLPVLPGLCALDTPPPPAVPRRFGDCRPYLTSTPTKESTP